MCVSKLLCCPLVVKQIYYCSSYVWIIQRNFVIFAYTTFLPHLCSSQVIRETKNTREQQHYYNTARQLTWGRIWFIPSIMLWHSSHIWWLLSQHLIALRSQREGVDRAQLIHDQRGSSRTLLTVFSSNKKVHLILNIWLKPGIHAWQHAERGKILLLSFFFLFPSNVTSAPCTSWMFLTGFQ